MAARAGHNHRRWRLSGHKKPMIDVVRNDINVTPLVDVMLVLLIIFMLMTLIMGRGHELNLPKAANYSQEKDKMQPVLSIDEKGDLWLEKNRLGASTDPNVIREMDDQVQTMWKAPKNVEGAGRIYLKADATVQYSVVYPVLEYLNKTMQMQQVDLAIAKDTKEN